MSEETAQPSSEPAAAPEAPTLDSVYQEFNVEEQAASFQPQSQPPVAQPAAPAFKVPDAFDPNFQAYQAQIANGLTALNQRTSEALSKLNAIEQRAAQQQTEADIKTAVGKIAEKSGLDPKFAEVAFQLKAKEDPRLLQIWNNRGKNPKALEKALEAVSSEFKQTYTVRQDPQLVENQRAVAASRNSMATTQKQSPNDEWDSMTPGERQAKVRMMITRGG